VRHCSGRMEFILLAVALAGFAATEARGDDWVFYGASFQKEDRGPELRDWYELNRLKPVAQTQATAYHYYDRDSLGYSSPFPGGIVRVWEKAVFQRETKTYEEAKEEVEREEEKRLNRKITIVDYAWLFPIAVKRAAKEITTLYEINCDSKEFFIMEVNSHDKTGDRLTRETIFDKDLWLPIQHGTLMEALSKEICR
jgi:hypothetical protein